MAIFTKFDDLMVQIYDMDIDDDENRQIAEAEVERKFRKPLSGYAFPPRADVCFEGKCSLILCHSVDWIAQRSTFCSLTYYRNRSTSGPGESSHREDGILPR